MLCNIFSSINGVSLQRLKSAFSVITNYLITDDTHYKYYVKVALSTNFKIKEN